MGTLPSSSKVPFDTTPPGVLQRCQRHGGGEILLSTGTERVQMVVELRKQLALEPKLRGGFGKLSFVNVCGSRTPKARDGFAAANLLRRRVASVDPLPDEPAEPVIARGAVRVIFPDVQDKFVVAHLNPRTHGSLLLHRDVKRDLQSLL